MKQRKSEEESLREQMVRASVQLDNERREKVASEGAWWIRVVTKIFPFKARLTSGTLMNNQWRCVKHVSFLLK